MGRPYAYTPLLLLTLYALLTFGVQTKTRYDNHKVLRANLTKEQLPLLESLSLDLWTDSLTVGPNDFRVTPEQLIFLEKHGISYEILIPNVQDLIDEEEISQAAPDPTFFNLYQRYSTIVNYLQQLAKDYPQITSFVPSIGKTVEGRDIPALLISVQLGKNTSSVLADKNTLFISAGQHAREWIAPSTALYILTQLLDGYGVNSRITEIINEFNYVWIPLSNPDGYEFTHTTTRLWRKNRRNNGGNVYGVDLNRNWDYKWGGDGSSTSPSSDTYAGTGPFSEPETKAISDYFLSTGSIVGALDYHSYSQLILRPYGDSTAPPPNDVNLVELGALYRNAILSVGGATYTSQKAIQLYPTTGTARDWYYANCIDASRFGYTIELRDTGRYGFILPTSEIIPTGRENLAAFIEFAQYIKKINTK